ncbi:MAG: SAM hydroxide adenosyltransferase [Blastopirellula sp. JB062]
MAAKLIGSITAISESGDLISDISHDQLAAAPTDERTTVTCDEHRTLGVYPAEHQQPEMTYVAVLGKSGFLELCIVGESAAAFLGIRPGAKVEISW